MTVQPAKVWLYKECIFAKIILLHSEIDVKLYMSH